ncbi:hypothetical protein MON38_21495 [Hymenobacter sp. DH14]|uniref:Uncharacterized protein n=1 Tax=Hymenobacter cyanobacteriorum TaxID=2926463 RepID=A0A9X1VJK0_9BACT|nr:hypothetical protein [Hymenobacter cyanobacteriorum]MCI1190006.1 hypothetical protein [Hymenobacter cyanobacteriorum]
MLLTGYHHPVKLPLFDTLSRPVVSNPNPQGNSQPLDLGAVHGGMYLLQVRTAVSLEKGHVMRE